MEQLVNYNRLTTLLKYGTFPNGSLRPSYPVDVKGTLADDGQSVVAPFGNYIPDNALGGDMGVIEAGDGVGAGVVVSKSDCLLNDEEFTSQHALAECWIKDGIELSEEMGVDHRGGISIHTHSHNVCPIWSSVRVVCAPCLKCGRDFFGQMWKSVSSGVTGM